MTGQPKLNAMMGELLRRGRGARPVAEEAGDDLARLAQRLGCIDVDALRTLADAEGLKGAALFSRVAGTLRERPWLAPELDTRLAAIPEGLSGGAGRSEVDLRSGTQIMSDSIREARDRQRYG